MTYKIDREGALKRKAEQEAKRAAAGGIFEAHLEGMRIQQEMENAGKAYDGRDMIPEQYLGYCDWFVQKTGIEPDGKVKGAWIKEFLYWSNKRLTIKNLDDAWVHAGKKGWQGDIIRPQALGTTAVALKAKKTLDGPSKYVTGEYAEWVNQ